MLSVADNELLCRVGPGTPMHSALRRHWIPAVRSAKLVADGAPVRVRLLGSNYVGFRASDGRVGFFDEGCPHRGVSLVLGHNRDCALTCLFHGWKFSVDGTVLEVPTEPVPERFAPKVHINHYPVEDRGGIVWVWLGDETARHFPAFDFVDLPKDNILTATAVVRTNWLSTLEGGLDASHVGILHQSFMPGQAASTLNAESSGGIGNTRADLAPRYELDKQPYGYRAAALRSLPDGKVYARITEFVEPWYSLIPFAADEEKQWNASVPIDDEHTLMWFVYYNRTGALQPGGTADMFNRMMMRDSNYDDFNDPTAGPANNWHQNRDAMIAGTSWTGWSNPVLEDFAMSESCGAIPDRSKEKLGSSDRLITAARHWLLDMARNGGRAFGALPDVDYCDIRATAGNFDPVTSQWQDVPR